jgi:hypothetical protein
MYVKYRGWIQSEIEAALAFSKPIIAVYPYGCERVPSELNALTVTKWVGWRGSSVTSAIREHAPVPPPSLDALSEFAGQTPPSPFGAIPVGELSTLSNFEALISGLNPPKKK